MTFKSFNLLLFIGMFFFACFFTPDLKVKSGVVLTFDDRNVADWVWADSILSGYDWKATFCVAGPQVLTASQFCNLRDLQAAGHEIAGHGVAHRNAVDYVAANGMAAYINDEILPMIDIMDREGICPVTFAYPYGTHSEEIDDTLLSYFNILRSTTYTWSDPSSQTCYYENSPLVCGFGTDGSATQSRIDYFLSLLEYARDNQRIVILYSHKPVPEWAGANQTDILTLEAICTYVRSNRMQFYTLSDIAGQSASKVYQTIQTK